MSKALLLEKAKNTSHSSGVYRMLDKDGKVLYVGKAKNLHNRVQSYFRDVVDDDKTRVLVGKIRDFEVILTDSEAEALILESILIKKHKPRYNILLKDDKSYPYVLIDEGHSFPRLIYTRRPKKKKNQRIFGPFATNGGLREAVRFLNQLFKLRDCSDVEFLNRSRPCLNFQIGICSAPCTAQISAEDYQRNLAQALSVLSGKSKVVLQELASEMDRYSEEMEYEKAASIRDQIKLLEDTILTGKQNVDIESGGDKDIQRDVIGFHRTGENATISLMLIRHGRLVDSASFHFQNLPQEQASDDIVKTFLAQYYLTQDELAGEDNESAIVRIPGTEEKRFPNEILLPMELPAIDVFEESFTRLGARTKFLIPERGQKHDQILLANKNAEHALDEKLREQGNIFRVLAELKAKLRLENYPRRMECFDISNLGDSGIVASRVVFIEGKPEKSLYRHYKIRESDSQNDFAAMKEVLRRRLEKLEEDDERPDLLIIDGGKGQLSMAVEVVKELNITGLDLVSLAKSKTESDFASGDVQKTFERVFKPGRANPINLAPDSNICHLMERIRDEAHRFAVEFQRKQREIK